MNMKYTTDTTETTKDERIENLEVSLKRAERNARMNQSRADTWRHYFRQEEKKNNTRYMEGLGVGLMIGAAATIIDMMVWKKLLK